MKIRRELDKGSDVEPEETLIGITGAEQLFIGSCMGVALKRRGKDDPHIMFVPLVEDDRNWFPKNGNHGGSSSYWLPEAIAVLQVAREWCIEHADPDIVPEAAGYPPNTVFGWKFRA